MKRSASLLSVPEFTSTAITHMANAIEALVNKKDHVTFSEIEEEVEGFRIPTGGEGPYIGIGGPGFIWCASEIGNQAFKLLMHQRRICLQVDTLGMSNFLDRQFIYQFMDDKNWVPFTLRPAKYINYIAATSGLCFCMSKEDVADCKRKEKRQDFTSITV